MSASEFFAQMAGCSGKTDNHSYYNAWKAESDKINLPEFEFSNFYVAQKLAQIIPENSILHCAILNSTRIMQFFPLSKGVILS